MKHFAACLFSLSFAANIFSLTVNSTVLKNDATGKHIILLGEIHAQYVRQTLTGKQQAAYDIVEQQQKQSFAKFIDALLTLDSQQAAHAVIITETSPNTLGCLFEQEAGFVAAEDHNDETLCVMPRILMKTLLAAAKTTDEKIARFQSSITPFNDVPAATFVFGTGLRWIAGDTARTEKDTFLCFIVYMHWKSILEALNNKEDIPEELLSLTIDHVKAYITTWHDTFVSHGIYDPYAQEIISTLDHTLQVGNLSVDCHMAAVHEYLRTHGDVATSDALNNNFLKCISLKTDFELCRYIRAFEQDPKLKQLIIHFGSAHTRAARELLCRSGYDVIERIGYDPADPTTEEDLKEQALKAVTFLENHPDMLASKHFLLESARR